MAAMGSGASWRGRAPRTWAWRRATVGSAVLAASMVAGPAWTAPDAAAEPALAGVAVGDVETTEGEVGTHQVVFPVRLAAPVAATVTVDYATVNGTARAGSDYDATAGRLTFAPGDVSKSVPVVVRHDAVNDIDETFFLELRDATNVAIADGSGRALIRDDEQNPLMLPSDVVAPEGDGGDQTLRVPVRLNQPAHLPVSVDYATGGGTASAGSDYTAVSGTLTFGPGEVAKTIDVVVHADTVAESNESFRIQLTNGVRANIGIRVPASAAILLVDDDEDPPLPDLGRSVAIGGAFVQEGDFGDQIVFVPVRLDAPSSDPVTVDYATDDGRATAPDDYEAVAGTLTFAPGEVAKAIPVTVHGETRTETMYERFRVDLTNPTGATITTGQARITTYEKFETRRPRVDVTSATVREGDQGNLVVTLTVFPSAPLYADQTFELATASSDAGAGTDYVHAVETFTFTPESGPATFVVRVLSDLDQEAIEQIAIRRKAAGSDTAVTAATITVLDGGP